MLFILQGDAEPLSSAPVWAEPSQLLIGKWAQRQASFRFAPSRNGLTLIVRDRFNWTDTVSYLIFSALLGGVAPIFSRQSGHLAAVH